MTGRPLGHDGHKGDQVLGDVVKPLVRGGSRQSFLVVLGRSVRVASSGTLKTTAPFSGAGPATPVVNTVARVATANRLPLAPPVPDSILSDTSATLGSEGEAWLELLVGRLGGASASFPTSVLLVSLVDLLGSLSNDLFTWAETHPVGDPEALRWSCRVGPVPA